MIISDLHIGMYSHYNPVPDFRLDQFLKLSDKIVTESLKLGIKELWIAGDLLVTPKSHPKVMHYLKLFCNKITDSGIIIRLIYGNHDLQIKRLESGTKEFHKSTLLSLLHDGDKVYCYDDEVVEVLGHSIHFSSWRPGNKIDTKDAEYLVCHGDVSPKISPFTNPDNLISTDGYKRVIAGHIHVPLDTNNFTSPGAPIPHSFGDNQNTSLVVLDLDSNKVTRISTKDEFLTFIYAKDKEDKHRLESHYESLGQHASIKIKKEKVKLVVDNDGDKVSLDNLNIDPKSTLLQFTSKLSPLAQSLVIDTINNSSTEEDDELTIPNLNFKFTKLTIKNFLSIRNEVIDFNDYHGLVCIVGHNG